MYKTILVPLDGSERAEKILPHVQGLAQVLKARIILMTVVEPLPLPPTPALMMEPGMALRAIQQSQDGVPQFDRDEQHRREMADYLQGVQARLAQEGLEVETHVTYGDAVVAHIMTVAEQQNADLIAIASHGRTGLRQAFYGSVAASLLQRIDRPLLLIRAT